MIGGKGEGGREREGEREREGIGREGERESSAHMSSPYTDTL